ncbi:uncharacterized protein LOC127987962 [Carassius gibelio]|uniref:uncharacterized protein LOC127987962 n=1 Tax=Carassius gibelio TaxID=101364 RepID=UPI0022774C2E|nr:uncharacterized protein LOC127987962 [Carassius gibelio]
MLPFIIPTISICNMLHSSPLNYWLKLSCPYIISKQIASMDLQGYTSNTNLTTTISKRSFIIPQGLNVCFLTDSICRDIKDYMPKAQCWVHPGTTLIRSAMQHIYHFKTVHSNSIVILHIGTNDIASGAPASVVIQRMKTLITRISLTNPHILYYGISAILPRPTDNSTTKNTVKEFNSLLRYWTEQTTNIIFLNTTKPFLKSGKIIHHLYKQDGLHLTTQGKQRLFAYFQPVLSQCNNWK